MPRDYDVNAAIEFGRSLRLPRLPFNEDLVGRELVRTYESMYKAFQHGGAQDLQRSYNGMVGGGKDEFVGAFKDAASFNLGVVGRAAGLSPDEIAIGGGLFNKQNQKTNPGLDTSGTYFNDPDNFRMIQEGIRGHDSGLFLRRTPRNEQGDDQGRTAIGQAGGFDPNFGLPQHVIDAGNLLRANGYEITPRTMYLAHVLGPQAAVDLINRTKSTSSPAVPSPDAATGDQMRAWVRALRLGPAAQAGAVGGMTPAPNPGPMPPDQFNTDALDPNQPFA